ncbi:MAG: cytochrome b N-terminal domain-containing protein [Acidobacteria bacterium]|nr:cytochrome b N-terminal domain-containing protein [Acidobacteriota bacterium]
MYKKFLQLTKNLTVSLEKGVNFLTTHEHNPLYFHGALPLYTFWFLIFSGIMLWMYYIPTLERAWSSVNYITSLPVFLKDAAGHLVLDKNGAPIVDAVNSATGIPYGAVVRGIHRWGAAAMMITTLLHMFRVYFTDRHRSWRWLPWISGVFLLLFVLFVGITGYLLVWDARAYRMVVETQDWLRAMPLIGNWSAEFLVGGTGINDYTLTRFFFFHIGGATLLFVLVWVHFIRLHDPVVTPSRATNFLTLGFILVAAGALPAINITEQLIQQFPSLASDRAYIGSDSPAQIGVLVETMRYDAWYLFPYYLINKAGVGGAWAILGASTLLLMVAPFYPKDRRDNLAAVIEAKCTGCTFCSLDCPFEAITMQERAPGSKFKLIAVVQEARCSECGVCVGACPFQAIELPNTHSKTIEAEVLDLLKTGA